MIEHQWRMYLGFLFGGGGGSKYFLKTWGYICMARSQAFDRGSGACFSEKKK